MKELIKEKMEKNEVLLLTPKRKSILWRYRSDDDDAVIAYGISKERSKLLSNEFSINENISFDKNEIHKCKELDEIADDGGVSVLLENTAARIWELCDGSNNLYEIVKIISEEYNSEFETVYDDIKQFLRKCEEQNVIDIMWRNIE